MVIRYFATSVSLSLLTAFCAQAGAAEYYEKTYILQETKTQPVKQTIERVQTGPGVSEYRYQYTVPATVVKQTVIGKPVNTAVVVEKPVVFEKTVERPVIVEKPVYVPIIDRPLRAVERDRIADQPVVIEKTVEKPVIIKERGERRHLLHIGLPLVNINAL